MGGDSLCPHPIWRQNSVPARSAFTQSGREAQTPGPCPYSIWRPREGHADFPLLVFCVRLRALEASRTSFEFRRAALRCTSRVAGAGRSSDFRSSLAVRKVLSVAQSQSVRRVFLGSQRSLSAAALPISAAELQIGLETLGTRAGSAMHVIKRGEEGERPPGCSTSVTHARPAAPRASRPSRRGFPPCQRAGPAEYPGSLGLCGGAPSTVTPVWACPRALLFLAAIRSCFWLHFTEDVSET